MRQKNILALGESEWMNAARLKLLGRREKGVQLRDYPKDIVTAARVATQEALETLGCAGSVDC